MEQTIFYAINYSLGFFFLVYVVPALLNRKQWPCTVILTLSVFMILDLLSPNDFDFIDRIWRGSSIGLFVLFGGVVMYYVRKWAQLSSK